MKKRLVNGDIITGSRTNFRPPLRKQQIRRFDSRNRITASSGRALIRNSSAARYSVVAPEIRPVSFRLSRNFHGSLTLANFCKRSGGGAKSWTGARTHTRSLGISRVGRSANIVGRQVVSTSPSPSWRLFPRWSAEGLTIAANTVPGRRQSNFNFRPLPPHARASKSFPIKRDNAVALPRLFTSASRAKRRRRSLYISVVFASRRDPFSIRGRRGRERVSKSRDVTVRASVRET